VLERGRTDFYALTGNALSVAAGRISYALGLRGPCLAVDTACSASLVAVHLACQAIRTGECEMAVVAGINLLLAPEMTLALNKALSKKGLCQAFDASADGFVRSDGLGVVVLKRLSSAERDKNRIRSLVLGTAVNHDGRSNGLAAPNGLAQEEVLRAALARSRVEPSEVDYIECHGTGTVLGDPVEVNAIGAVFGEARPATRPVLLGSVKSNIGHTEAAAGVAGLIKTVLALEHEEVPANLHFVTPNPHVQWSELPVRVVANAVPWARGSRRRIAGVSSFGISGTNAHVLVEEAPGRAHARNHSSVVGRVPEKVAFLFPGQGSEYVGMGRALFETNTVYRHTLERCAALIDAQLERPLLEVMFSDDQGSAIHESRFAQPAIFATAVALAAFWRSWGVEPAVVAGQSQGEIAAATISGALSLEDAVNVVCRRSRLLHRERGRGGTAAIGLSEAELREWLAPYGSRLSIAIVNSEVSTVVSGDNDALAALLSSLESAGVFCRRTPIEFAGHSAQMDPLSEELCAGLSDVRPRDGTILMYSTVTSEPVRGHELGNQYWARNLREPVQFRKVARCLRAEGCTVFVELSAHPLLETTMSSLDSSPGSLYVPSLRRNEDDWQSVLSSLDDLTTRCLPVDWRGFVASLPSRPVPLPGCYPLERTAHLLLVSARTQSALTRQVGQYLEHLRQHPEQPLADVCFTAAVGRSHLENRIAIVAKSREQLMADLQSMLGDGSSSQQTRGAASPSNPPRVAFAFPDQTALGTRTGRILFETQPVFRAAIERCAEAADEDLGRSLLDVVYGGTSDGAREGEGSLSGAALFAVQYGLFELWRSWGIKPDALSGCGLGEYAAACAAGVFSVEDGLRLVIAHARLLSQAGATLEEFQGLAESVVFAPPRTRLLGSVSVDSREGAATPEYWLRLLGTPSRPDPPADALYELGITSVIELGPTPSRERGMEVLPSLSTSGDDWETLLESLATLHRGGIDIDWPAFEAPYARRYVELPTYAFDPQRYWVDLSKERRRDVPEEVARPAPQHGAELARSAEPVVLSGRTSEALDQAARRLKSFIDRGGESSLRNVAFGLATERPHHEHRLSLVATSLADLQRKLERVCNGEAASEWVHGERGRGGLAWLFTGQGSQHLGMGRGLYEEWPVFREAMDASIAALRPHMDVSLEKIMWGEDASALQRTDYAQAALFALGWSLSALWRSWGVTPDMMSGHSLGELSAACVAGVFTLEDGARLVAARGRCMQALPSGGAMVAIQASESSVKALLARFGSVSVAAVNGPGSVVISGAEAEVMAVAEAARKQGAGTKRLSVSHAFHSALMDPMLEEFRRVAESVTYRQPTLRFVSNVSGAEAGPEVMTAAYWVKHVREAVRFGEGLRALSSNGVDTFIELGPKATLLGLVPACVPEKTSSLVATLERGRGETESALRALSALHARGREVRWSGVFDSSRDSQSGESTGHPLLGRRLGTVTHLYEGLLSPREHAWLYEHRVLDEVVVPGAGVAELIRAAAAHVLERNDVEVSSVVFQAPFVLPEIGTQRVQIVLKEEAERTEALVYSQRADSGAKWTLHARGEFRLLEGAAAPEPLDLEAIGRRCTEPVDVARIYEGISSIGIEYDGVSFRGLRRLTRGVGEALAEVSLDEEVEGAEAYGIHPALLDAFIQAGVWLANGCGSLVLPFAIERLVVHEAGVRGGLVHIRETASVHGHAYDLTLADPRGRVLVEVGGLQLRPVDQETFASRGHGTAEDLYRVEWPEVALPSLSKDALPPGEWLLVSAMGDALADALAVRLGERGRPCRRVEFRGLGAGLSGAEHVVCVWGGVDADESEAAAAMRFAREGLSVVQALAKEEHVRRVLWVTQGAVSTAKAGADIGRTASQAALWGLGRTVMAEQPDLGFQLLDVEGGIEAGEIVLREWLIGDDETQVAWRKGKRHVARLAKAPPVTVSSAKPPFRKDGTVLVTGGLGLIGLQLARRLVEHGIRHVLLTSRRGMATPGAEEAVRSLEDLGADVTVKALDVTHGEGVKALIEEIPPERPLRGVIHAAGELDDGLPTTQTAERFERVMASKVLGASHLDAHTRSADLDFFVLLSSVAGTMGSAGQGAYAAANVYLDALASRRQAEGRPGQSLSWGIWTDAAGRASGLASGVTGALRTRQDRSGLGAVTPKEGAALFEACLMRPEAHLLPVPLRLSVFRKSVSDPLPPLWRSLLGATVRKGRRSASTWLEKLRDLSPNSRGEAVERLVCTEVARILSLAGADAVDKDRPLKELGLDSLMAVEIRNALSKQLGAKLPATLAFDYPTSAAVATYVLGRLVEVPTSTPSAGGGAAVVPSRVVREPLTIESVKKLSQEDLLERFARELDDTLEPGRST
jgi:acyl transferase domain-containing protein/acyl carrier protein